jgi:hypothetical protein
MVPLGVPLCMDVIMRIEQALSDMVGPWRTYHRGLELWWWLCPRWCLEFRRLHPWWWLHAAENILYRGYHEDKPLLPKKSKSSRVSSIV